MHKLIIKYNKQLKMLNLRDGKTYTISEDERADITLKSLGEVIHLEQNNQGTWQANHTSINSEYSGIVINSLNTRDATCTGR